GTSYSFISGPTARSTAAVMSFGASAAWSVAGSRQKQMVARTNGGIAGLTVMEVLVGLTRRLCLEYARPLRHDRGHERAATCCPQNKKAAPGCGLFYWHVALRVTRSGQPRAPASCRPCRSPRSDTYAPPPGRGRRGRPRRAGARTHRCSDRPSA